VAGFKGKRDIPHFAGANQKDASSKLHFLGHLLDESLAKVHILYVLQLHSVHSAKRTFFACK
jgi:hypothetical protein